MSLLRRIEEGRGGRRLLRLLLDKLNQEGRLQSDIEAFLQDDANGIQLSEAEQAHLKANPVDFLQAAAQHSRKSGSASYETSPEVEPALTELRQEMLRRVEADDEMQSLKAQGEYPAIRARVQTLLDEALAEREENLSETERTRLFEALTQTASEYGPLDPLLSDPQISEIRVLGPDRIWVTRHGHLDTAAYRFEDPQHLLRTLERLVSQFGHMLDAARPLVRFKTPDGSQVTVTIPPLSSDGAVLTLRKHRVASYLTRADLVQFGTLHQEAMAFLSACVKANLNILITGQAFTGTTTLMVALGDLISNDDFIVVVDDDLEVGALPQEQVLHLQTRPSGPDRLSEINQTQLMQHALAMNAEHVLLGDVDGSAMNELIRAWTHWLATMRAYRVEDALGKLETAMRALRGDDPLIPMRIAEAVDLVVHVERLRSGARRVERISELRYVDGALVAHDIYALELLNRKYEARLHFVNRPQGEQFDLPEIKTLFEGKP